MIPGLGRSPGEGHGNLLQRSCLENPVDRRAWRATVHGVAQSDVTERLSTRTLMFFLPSQSKDLIFSNCNLHGFIHPHRTRGKEPLLRGREQRSQWPNPCTRNPQGCPFLGQTAVSHPHLAPAKATPVLQERLCLYTQTTFFFKLFILYWSIAN